MKRAGALKAYTQQGGEEGAVACDHGSQHDGVVLGEPQRSGQSAHGSGKSQQAGARRALQAAHSTGEEEARRVAQAVNTVDAHRFSPGDALINEKIFAAPDAGIVIDLRRQQTNHGAEALTALEELLAGRTVWALRPPSGDNSA